MNNVPRGTEGKILHVPFRVNTGTIVMAAYGNINICL